MADKSHTIDIKLLAINYYFCKSDYQDVGDISIAMSIVVLNPQKLGPLINPSILFPMKVYYP